MTDLDLAQAAADIYGPTGDWLAATEIQGVYVALRDTPAGTIVCFRGSVTQQDWWRDFEALPVEHPTLGWCEGGFLEGMNDAAARVVTCLPDGPYGIAGHSLGAARALIAAGLLTAAKRPPERVLALGCPKPGFQKLSDLILAGGYPVMCVRNGPDPVAAVPLTLPDLPYCKPVADTAIHEPPADPADPFAWHHVQLYLDGVRKLAAIAS